MGSPKGGRVHWFWYLLSPEIKKRFTLSMNYGEHNYLLYRRKKSTLVSVVAVVRTCKRCFRMTYHNALTGKSLYKAFKSARALAEWLNEYLTFEINEECDVITRERQEQHFARTLKKLMKQRNVTQSTLSLAVHISQQGISKIINRKWYPPKEVVKRIAEFFGVDVDIFNCS